MLTFTYLGENMTIKEIAKMAGVSTATVSRAINNSGYIKIEVKEKILRIIEETGFTPSSVAQDLKRNRTNLIGVIIPKISSFSVAQVVDGISLELNKRNFSILLANTNNNAEEELKYLKIFQEKRANGILILGTEISEEHKNLIKSSSIPVIVIGQNVSEAGIPCVVQQEKEAAYDITRYLTDNNHKRIAYIGTDIEDFAVRNERKAGFLKALADSDIYFDEKCTYYSGFSSDTGYTGIKKLLKEFPDLTAVFCATGTMATGAVNALLESGAGVPENVSVTGMGSTNYGINTLKITSVIYDYVKTGSEGAKMLLNILDNKTKSEKISVPYRFFQGNTVKKI